MIPSRRTLCALLGLDDAEGRAVRRLLERHDSKEFLYATLASISDVIGGCGVEYLPSKQDTPLRSLGIEYVNTGDVYTPTVLYDCAAKRFVCACLGDVVERNRRRF